MIDDLLRYLTLLAFAGALISGQILAADRLWPASPDAQLAEVLP